MWGWPWLDVVYYETMVEEQFVADTIEQARWTGLATKRPHAFVEQAKKALGIDDKRSAADIIEDTIASDGRRHRGRS